MSVFRELSIIWKGQTYTLTPSNKLLRKIEGEGINLARMMQEAEAGQPSLSYFAGFLAMMMQAAGAEVSEDDMFGELVNDPDGAMKLAGSLFEAILPSPAEAKKPEAP